MKKLLFSILFFLSLSGLAFLLSSAVYYSDGLDALVYLFFYTIFLLIFLVFTIRLGIRIKKQKSKNSTLFYLILFVWIPLIGFPSYSIALLNHESELRQKEIEKQETFVFKKKLREINSEIAQYPDSALLYLQKARIFRSHGEFDKAIVETEYSLDLELTSSALWELGWNHEISRNYIAAESAYLQAQTNFPDEEWVETRLAVVRNKLKEID